VLSRVLVVRAAGLLPITRELADRYAVRTLHRRLAGYGHAEFTSDHDTYTT
jgi:hypothetical protein